MEKITGTKSNLQHLRFFSLLGVRVVFALKNIILWGRDIPVMYQILWKQIHYHYLCKCFVKLVLEEAVALDLCQPFGSLFRVLVHGGVRQGCHNGWGLLLGWQIPEHTNLGLTTSGLKIYVGPKVLQYPGLIIIYFKVYYCCWVIFICNSLHLS